MVGANYMGGKRNTARTKSKDVVGRAQRRHFGKQRLLSALCVAQGKRIHTNTETSSSLPEITLAHARRAVVDSAATSSRIVSRDGFLNLSSTLTRSNTTQRKKPSKILGALDTSDQDLSMRAAIDRILQQSNLLGINTEKLGEIAPVECMQSPTTVARSTQTCLTPKDSDASEPVSEQGIDTPVTLAATERTGFWRPNQNARHRSPESEILSQPDSPPGDVQSQRSMDNSRYAETKMLTGVHTFFRAEGKRPDVLLDSLYSLPRSSPFASSSLASNGSLLDLDTSPFTGIPFGCRPNDQSEESCMDTRNVHPIPLLCPSSQRFSLRGRPASVDEAQSTILSFTNSDEEELEAERSRATCYDNIIAFSSTANDEFRDPFPLECRYDTFHNVMGSSEATENDIPNGIPIDFLSDPLPWETIGRILGLESSGLPAAQFSTVNFTNNREGVGYVSLKRSAACNARPSNVASFEARIDDDSEDDTCVVSATDPPVLPNTDLGIGNADGCIAAESPCVESSIAPLLDWEPSVSAANAFVDVDMLQGTPAVRCTKKANTRSAPPRTTAVEGTAPESDMILAGPCLFGDSDLEEDE